jgi:hypothetical protein
MHRGCQLHWEDEGWMGEWREGPRSSLHSWTTLCPDGNAGNSPGTRPGDRITHRNSRCQEVCVLILLCAQVPFSARWLHPPAPALAPVLLIRSISERVLPALRIRSVGEILILQPEACLG